jgi:diguanylate cyclase (GGDEF)-like protein/PAS domain S-box-containing protein
MEGKAMDQNRDVSPFELFKYMPGGFLIYSAYHNEDILFVNDYIIKLYGCCHEKEFMELVHGSFKGMVHPDDLDHVESEIKQQVENSLEGYDYVEYRIIQKNGQVRWVDDYGRLIHQANGEDVFYVFIVDSTEKKQLQYELKRRNDQQQVLIDMAKDVVFDVSYHDKTIDIYGKFEERFGRKPCLDDFQKLLGQHIIDEQYQIHMHQVQLDYQNFDSDTDEIYIRNHRNENIWSQCQLAKFYDDNAQNSRIVGRLLDTHYQILKQKHYQRDAQRDPLTGIYNRRMARGQIDSLLAQMDETQECLLAIFDIDDFKEINDTYGHPIGDSVLKYVAYGLMEFHGEHNVYSRIGGDEFLLFIPDVQDKKEILTRIERLTLIEPDQQNYLIKSIPRVTISIGVVCQKGNRYNCDVLYYLADKALYGTKKDCKGTMRIYNEKEMG